MRCYEGFCQWKWLLDKFSVVLYFSRMFSKVFYRGLFPLLFLLIGLFVFFRESAVVQPPLHSAALVQEKVLICGICRNIEKAVPNTIASIKKLGDCFLDYRAIIYENNSTDQTKAQLQAWADSEPHVLFMSEQLSARKLASDSRMKKTHRIEKIARARNIVLERAMKEEFDDYQYVIWADLDFLEPWDVDSIVETILHPEQPWDAVLSYGAYDLFAFRSPECPIGFELVGDAYWDSLEKVRGLFQLDRAGPWKRVYSAFGGLGIYRREAIVGCRYSGVVTPDLEKAVTIWLDVAQRTGDALLLDQYQQLLMEKRVIRLEDSFLLNREKYGDVVGIQMPHGKLVWFSCTENATLPWTCEHVPFHASMMVHGYDKIFVNPKLHSGD